MKYISYHALHFRCKEECPHGYTIGSMPLYFPFLSFVLEPYKRYKNRIVGVGSSICEMCLYYCEEESKHIRYGAESMKGIVACKK